MFASRISSRARSVEIDKRFSGAPIVDLQFHSIKSRHFDRGEPIKAPEIHPTTRVRVVMKTSHTEGIQMIVAELRRKWRTPKRVGNLRKDPGHNKAA